MRLISKIKDSRPIPIVLADGTRDSVNLQGRSKIDLPEGAVIDPQYAASLASSLTIQGQPVKGVAAGSNAALPQKEGSPLADLTPTSNK